MRVHDKKVDGVGPNVQDPKAHEARDYL